jgi:hypothetical protein
VRGEGRRKEEREEGGAERKTRGAERKKPFFSL